MKMPPLSTLLSAFFLRYLAVERGVSPHTSTSYRDAIKLLLQFSATRCKRPVDQLVIEDLNAPVVLDFLSHLETGRTTRSARAMRGWPPFKHFSAISLANSPHWPLCAALFWRFRRKRRSALSWAI
jgi:site-specific recombinase XerC